MTRRKQIILIVCCVLLCLIILREIGIIDVHLYQSTLSATHSASVQKSRPGNDENFSYHVTIEYKNTPIYNHTYVYSDLPLIKIKGILQKPTYSGNYLLPLSKNFKMSYVCTFATTESPTGQNVEGKIEGEIVTKILGLCSQRKAKQLSLEEAQKHIQSYLKKQLNP